MLPAIIGSGRVTGPLTPSQFGHITRATILTVVSSSVVQSGADMADYQARRGLSPALTLSFSFPNLEILNYGDLLVTNGTTSPVCTGPGDYVGLPFFQAIDAMRATNAGQGVIVSTNTPSAVAGNGTFWPLAAYAGGANHWLARGSAGASDVTFPGRPLAWSSPKSSSAYTPFWSTPPDDWVGQQVLGGSLFMPHGRLGIGNMQIGDGASTPNTEAALFAGGSIYAAAITANLLAEQQSAAAKLHLASNGLGFAPYVPAAANLAGLEFLQARGFTVDNLSDQAGADIDANTFYNGADGPFDVFAHFIADSTYIQYKSPSPNAILVPGAIGMNWASSNNFFARQFAQMGGGAAIGGAGEPLAANINMPQEILGLLVSRRLTVMEAVYLASPTFSSLNLWSPGNTAYIDPLYSPWLST